MRSHRIVALFFLALLVLSSAVPAMAATESEGEGEVTPEVTSDYEPAVIVPTVEPEADAQPWTTRFLVPTGLLIAGIAIFATAVQYFTKVVRSRYKVVE